jgi:hypothetical protein
LRVHIQSVNHIRSKTGIPLKPNSQTGSKLEAGD